MPSLRQIKRRIRSIENTGKVTKAMEMIAASKMRRAQTTVLSGRPYSSKIRAVIGHLAATRGSDTINSAHPLLEIRPPKKIQVILLSPDRGLCGGLHSNLNRKVAQFISEQDVQVSLIIVGRKGRDFMIRYGQDVKAVFVDIGDRPTLLDTSPISSLLTNNFISGESDETYLAYAEFVNTTLQKPVIEKLLPIEPDELLENQILEYIYEPDISTVLEALLPRFVDMQVYHALLELIASEQSARMVAMRSATDSAQEMASDLTLLANKVRQESITNELLDIIGGTVAVGG